jgi:hypothetical protein
MTSFARDLSDLIKCVWTKNKPLGSDMQGVEISDIIGLGTGNLANTESTINNLFLQLKIPLHCNKFHRSIEIK